MQLEAALESFFAHAADADTARLVVLFRASSVRLQRQYGELAAKHDKRVLFIAERSFRSQLLEILSSGSQSRLGSPHSPWFQALRSRLLRQEPRAHDSGDYVLLLVDDDIFVHPFKIAVACQALAAHPEAVAFSLRLGRNTTHFYVQDRRQALPAFTSVADGILEYGWAEADGDFGYPFDISSSLYRRPMLYGMARRLPFEDPNTLEGQMSARSRRYARNMPSLLCFEGSVAFSTPLNRVQNVYTNRAAESPNYSPEALADLFDRGQRICWGAFDGFVPSACHQEVDVEFEPRS